MSKNKHTKIVSPPPDVPEEILNKPSVVGVVTDCASLNIRKEPSLDAPVVCEVPALSNLMIDFNKSSDGWVCVCTEAGIEGFCMKKYVAVKLDQQGGTAWKVY